MGFLYLLRDIVAFTVLFVGPGWLLARTYLPLARPVERAIVAVGAGFASVSVLAFTFAVCTLQFMSWVHVIGAAVAISALAGRGYLKRHRRGELPVGSSPLPGDRAALICTLAIGALFLVSSILIT